MTVNVTMAERAVDGLVADGLSARSKRRNLKHGLKKVGLEMEFPVVDKGGEIGHCFPIIRNLAQRAGWKLEQQAGVNGVVIVEAMHLSSGTMVVTDAGIGTLEIIMPPMTSMWKAGSRLAYTMREVTQAAKQAGLLVLGYGNQPVTPWSIDNLVPKKRYLTLLDFVGKSRLGKMTATAVLQCHVDADSMEEIVLLTNFFNAAAPVLIAQHANSWLVAGEDTGYCSWRESVWDDFGTRAGIFANHDKWWQDGQEMVRYMMEQSYQLHQNDKGEFVRINRPFVDWLEEADCSEEEAKAAWRSHEACLWPVARPRFAYMTVEVRTPDQQMPGGQMLFSAFCLGCAHNQEGMYEFLRKYSPAQAQEARYLAIERGMNWLGYQEMVHDAFRVAYRGLLRRRLQEMDCLRMRTQCPMDRNRSVYERDGLSGWLRKVAWR